MKNICFKEICIQDHSFNKITIITDNLYKLDLEQLQKI